MAQDEKTFLNRRQLARSAMIGGASVLFGAGALNAQQAPASRGMLDAHALGATGDGKTDDTAALQRALDAAGETSGGVFIPPGIYLTRELHVRPGTALVGIAAWNYRAPGGSVLRLASGDATCLLNLTGARGASIEGLSLDGRGLGKGIHGIATIRTQFAEHEDVFRIERCQVAHFTGDGAHLNFVWAFSVRHCELAFNHGDGLSLRGWDGFLLDNWFSGNERAGFAAREDSSSVTFTANRIEWNGTENMLVNGGNSYQITGNLFDRAGTCGIALRKSNISCTQITITGNFFNRSGKLADPESHDSAHIVMDGCEGVTCIGNAMHAYRDDKTVGTLSPSYGIIYRGLRNCVIRDNVLHNGALRQLLLDLGGHAEGVIVGENPGQLMAIK
jgi:hypothetical protein